MMAEDVLFARLRGHCQNSVADKFVKVGMELAWQQLKPLMQAALPYYEAGVMDTRLGQADAGKLAELAWYKEIAEYVSHNPEKL